MQLAAAPAPDVLIWLLNGVDKGLAVDCLLSACRHHAAGVCCSEGDDCWFSRATRQTPCRQTRPRCRLRQPPDCADLPESPVECQLTHAQVDVDPFGLPFPAGLAVIQAEPQRP